MESHLDIISNGKINSNLKHPSLSKAQKSNGSQTPPHQQTTHIIPM
jgi:hypothetical protein